MSIVDEIRAELDASKEILTGFIRAKDVFQDKHIEEFYEISGQNKALTIELCILMHHATFYSLQNKRGEFRRQAVNLLRTAKANKCDPHEVLNKRYSYTLGRANERIERVRKQSAPSNKRLLDNLNLFSSHLISSLFIYNAQTRAALEEINPTV